MFGSANKWQPEHTYKIDYVAAIVQVEESGYLDEPIFTKELIPIWIYLGISPPWTNTESSSHVPIELITLLL